MLKFFASFMLVVLGALTVANASSSFRATEGSATQLAQCISDSSTDSPQQHQGDCGDQHQENHQCHVGHCSFLDSSSLALSLPRMKSVPFALSVKNYLDVFLPGPLEPPRT